MTRTPVVLLALFLCAGCARTPEDEVHKQAGLAHAARKDYAKAVEEFDKAVALRPDKPRAYYMRGIARLKLGEKDKALADFGSACALKDADACTMKDRLSR